MEVVVVAPSTESTPLQLPKVSRNAERNARDVELLRPVATALQAHHELLQGHPYSPLVLAGGTLSPGKRTPEEFSLLDEIYFKFPPKIFAARSEVVTLVSRWRDIEAQAKKDESNSALLEVFSHWQREARSILSTLPLTGHFYEMVEKVMEERAIPLPGVLRTLDIQIRDNLRKSSGKIAQALFPICDESKGLVARIAYIYGGFGLPQDDLKQIGFRALLRAAKRFNPELGVFSTYAWTVISHEIFKEVRLQTRLIRLSATQIHRIRAAQKIAALGEDGPVSDEMLDLREREAMMLEASSTVPLNSLSHPESTHTLEEVLEDKNMLRPGDHMISFDGLVKIRPLLAKLPPRQRFVIERYYGVDGRKADLNYEVVGNRLSISREMVRLELNAAIEKLSAMVKDSTTRTEEQNKAARKERDRLLKNR